MTFPVAPETWLLFASAVLVMNITPGPDMLFVTATGLSRGPKAGVAAACGVSAGSLLHIVASIIGLSALLVAVPTLLEAIRLAGAVYLVWLGIQAIRAGKRGGSPFPENGTVPFFSVRRAFYGGVTSTLLNPKRALFVFAFLPQFIDPAGAPVPAQIAVLGATMVALELPFNALFGASGGRLGRALAANRHLGRLLSWLAGLTFFGLAARLALSRPQS
jgi:threonine/homoserine/homoserine lactone efflux protein